MAKPWAKKFYKSKQWLLIREIVILNQHGLCNKCGEAKLIEVHHKEKLTQENINDPNITLNIDNLEGLCRDCHFEHHRLEYEKVITPDGITFDDEGNLIERTKEAEES